MSKNSNQAQYLNLSDFTKTRNLRGNRSALKAAFSGFFAILLMALMVLPQFVSQNDTTKLNNTDTSAFLNFFCINDIGWGMDGVKNWRPLFTSYVSEDSQNRTLTLNQAVGPGFSFVNYEGESTEKEQALVRQKPVKTEGPGNYDEVKTKLEGTRSFTSCVSGVMSAGVPNIMFGLNEAYANFMASAIETSFSSNLICGVDSNKSNCIDLIGMIGGNGDTTTGIIGALTNSIYFPLSIIAVLITGIYIAKIGLIDRKFREAFKAAFWVVGAFIIGVIILVNPRLVAQAPMVVSKTVAGCVLSAFNGQNCMNDQPTSNNSIIEGSSDNICSTTASALTVDEKMQMSINGMNCAIWKTFYLQSWSQAQFGVPFSELDVKTPGTRAYDAVQKSGIDPEKFCVNLGLSRSIEDQGATLALDSDTNRVCNLGAYQAYMKVNAVSGNDTRELPDQDWYNLIVAVANDDGLYSTWAPNFGVSGERVMYGITTGLVLIMASIAFVPLSFFAMMYFMGGTILITFAPLFLLFGIHPGQGRKIMFGWVEQVVSSVLKYIASAVFLVIALALYSGVLEGVENLFYVLVFCFVLMFAIIMYRKEIVELVGRVNLSGEQLSNKFADKLKRGKEIGKSAAGSAVGAAIASSTGSSFKERAVTGLSGAASGAKDGAMRNIKRSGGLMGETARQMDRVSMDHRRDLQNSAKNIHQEKLAVDAQVNDVDSSILRDQNILAESESDHSAKQKELEFLKEKLDQNGQALDNMSKTALFKDEGSVAQKVLQMKQLDHEMTALDIKISLEMLEEVPDLNKVQEWKGLKDSIADEQIKLRDSMSNNDLIRGNRMFTDLFSKQIDGMGTTVFSDSDADEFVNAASAIKNAEQSIKSINENIEQKFIEKTNLQNKSDVLNAQFQGMNKAIEDWKPGDIIDATKLANIKKAAEEVGQEKLMVYSHDDENVPVELRGKFIDHEVRARYEKNTQDLEKILNVSVDPVDVSQFAPASQSYFVQERQARAREEYEKRREQERRYRESQAKHGQTRNDSPLIVDEESRSPFQRPKGVGIPIDEFKEKFKHYKNDE